MSITPNIFIHTFGVINNHYLLVGTNIGFYLFGFRTVKQYLRFYKFDLRRVYSIYCMYYIIFLKGSMVVTSPQGGGGGGGTLAYGLYRYVPQDRVWFLRLKNP